MKQLVLTQFDMPVLTVIALMIFVSIFVGMLFWVFRRNSKGLYETMGNIVFEEGAKK